MKKKRILTILLSLTLAITALSMFGCADSRATMPDEGVETIRDIGDDSNGDVSAFTNYKIEKVHIDPLFSADGTINSSVVTALKNKIGEADFKTKTTWSDPAGTSYEGIPYMESTAEDFSKVVIGGPDGVQGDPLLAGGLIIKLFDESSLPNETIDEQNARALASKWWQVVYRSSTVSGEKDILTFHMVEAYRFDQFNDEKANPNYSKSTVRTQLHTDLENVLTTLDVNNAIRSSLASASELPGQWQSNAFQTGTNSSGGSYGLGASGFSGIGTAYAVNNGLDGGNNLALPAWSGGKKVDSCYYDLITLPSSFEMIYMGKTKDISTETPYTTGTGEPGETIEAVMKGNLVHRSGLWRLHGLDRASSAPQTSAFWLRSGYSDNASDAGIVFLAGHNGHRAATSTYGLRPSLHLDLYALAEKVGIAASFDANIDAGTARPTCADKETATSSVKFIQFKESQRQAIVEFKAEAGRFISSLKIGENDILNFELEEINVSGQYPPVNISSLCTYEASFVDARTLILKISNIEVDSFNIEVTTTPLPTVKPGVDGNGSIEGIFDDLNGDLDGVEIELTKNVTISAPLIVPAGKSVALNLVSFIINRGLSSSGTSRVDGNVIIVYGVLILKANEEGAGKITGGNAFNGGGVYVANGGTLDMRGGTISGNKAKNSGGGVCVNGGTFIMSGGEITNNTATSGAGVGLLFGSFTMSGNAQIKSNTAANDGGGVSVFQSTFSMSDNAKITANEAQSGGGVHVYAYSIFKYGDGMVTGNTASKNSDVYNNGGIQGLR